MLEILGRDGEDVDRVRGDASLSEATCSATITPARSCASCVEARRGGRNDDVVELEQRATVRLFRKHVERRAACRSEARRRGVLIDELAARVDRRRPSLAAASWSRPMMLWVSAVSVRWSETVGRRQKLLERLRLFDTQVAKAVGATYGSCARTRISSALARRATCWPMRPNRRARASCPRARGRRSGTLPATFFQRRVGLRDVPRRQEESDRVLGGGHDRRLRRVGDHDSPP